MGTKVNTGNADDVKFKFEKAGDKLQGIYLGSEEFDNKGKMLTKHRIKNDEGKTVGFLGGYVLNQSLPQVPENSYVTIEFKGKKPLGGGKTLAEYDIEFDEPKSL